MPSLIIITGLVAGLLDDYHVGAVFYFRCATSIRKTY
jgi:hypothetical protein